MLTIALVAGLLIGQSLVFGQKAPSPQNPSRNVVDTRTFIRLIVAAAKDDFVAFRGKETIEGGLRVYAGTIFPDGTQRCIIRSTAEGTTYSCSWPPDEVDEDANITSCETQFKTMATDIDKALGGDWPAKKGWDEDTHFLLLGKEGGQQIELTNTNNMESGYCFVMLKVSQPKTVGKK